MRAQLWGKQFGKLTAIKVVQRGGKDKWLCHCKCGEYTIRGVETLIRSDRNAYEMACRTCVSAAKMLHAHFKKLWNDSTTLYTLNAERHMEEDIRDGIGQELGFEPEPCLDGLLKSLRVVSSTFSESFEVNRA